MHAHHTAPAAARHEDTVLRIRDLEVAYKVRGGEVHAVTGLSFAIRRGESFAVVGESGCGKSTVAWAIVKFLGANGYVRHGSIKFQGQELVGQDDETMRRLCGNRIAMVFQDPMQSLNPSLRIGTQLAEVLTVHRGLANEDARHRSVDMLERVHMPDAANVMNRYPHEISGGQQQRVVIAMALLNDPALLIMDEPTTALDVTVEATVLDLVAELRRDFDTAIMYISHNLGVVARVATHVGVMYAGELVERAPVEDVFARPQHPYTQGLLRCVPRLDAGHAGRALYPIPGRVPSPDEKPAGCVFTPRCDYAAERCEREHPALRRLQPGVRVRCHFAEDIDPDLWTPPAQDAPAAPGDRTPRGQGSASETAAVGDTGATPAPGEPILTVGGLTKHYPVRGSSLKDVLGLGEKHFVKAVEGASFELGAGTTLGIVGESGCGKSTLIKTIIGLEGATAGRAEFMGFDITQRITERDVRLIQELQMVFQNPDATMNPAYTVGQQIARPLRRFNTVPDDEVRAEVVRLLESMRLSEDYYERVPRQLSGGEKQRVGIARALATRPDLLLCDEPVSALDVSVQAAILNLLVEIQRRHGTAMIFIAHDLSVVRFLADDVAVMYLGQLMEIGPAKATYEPPFHPYSEALLSAVPIPDPQAPQSAIRLEGTVPSALDPPTGCRFHTRCPRRELLPDGGAVCEEEEPPWRDAGDGHRIFCHVPLETLVGVQTANGSHRDRGTSPVFLPPRAK